MFSEQQNQAVVGCCCCCCCKIDKAVVVELLLLFLQQQVCVQFSSRSLGFCHDKCTPSSNLATRPLSLSLSLSSLLLTTFKKACIIALIFFNSYTHLCDTRVEGPQSWGLRIYKSSLESSRIHLFVYLKAHRICGFFIFIFFLGFFGNGCCKRAAARVQACICGHDRMVTAEEEATTLPEVKIHVLCAASDWSFTMEHRVEEIKWWSSCCTMDCCRRTLYSCRWDCHKACCVLQGCSTHVEAVDEEAMCSGKAVAHAAAVSSSWSWMDKLWCTELCEKFRQWWLGRLILWWRRRRWG